MRRATSLRTYARSLALVRELVRELDYAHERARDLTLARDWEVVHIHGLDLVSDLDLTSGLNLTSDLANTLDHALAHARASAQAPDLTHARISDLYRVNASDLAHDLASALDHHLTHAHSRDLDRARVLARDFDLARTRAHARARSYGRICAYDATRVNAFGSARVLARDLDLACAQANALVDALDRACDLARDIARDLANVSALDRVRARAIADDITHARRSFASSVPSVASTGVASGTRSTPGRVTRSLVALVVWLQPAAQRPRYREEFGVELVELSRWRRLGYALRLLASAWELRCTLVEAMPTSDDEPARRADQ
jgi:hypothetical protein